MVVNSRGDYDKKVLGVGFVLMILTVLLALSASPVMAAQGQITEVNPSGIAAQGQIVDVNPPGMTVADGITDVGDIISNTPSPGGVIDTFEPTRCPTIDGCDPHPIR